jgi:hypothetical protein
VTSCHRGWWSSRQFDNVLRIRGSKALEIVGAQLHDNEHDRDLVLMSLSTRQTVNLSTCQPVNGPIGSKVNGSRSRSTRRAMIGWRSQLLSLADDLGELHSMLAFEPGMADSGINMNTPAADIAESLGLNIGRTSDLEADRKVWENLRVFLLISRYGARLRLDRLLRDKNLTRKALTTLAHGEGSTSTERVKSE